MTGFGANNILALMTEIDSFYAQFRTIRAYTYSPEQTRLRSRFPLVWTPNQPPATISPALNNYIASRQALQQRYDPAAAQPIPIPIT